MITLSIVKLTSFIVWYYYGGGGSGFGLAAAVIILIIRLVVWAARSGNAPAQNTRRPTTNYVNTSLSGAVSSSPVGQYCQCKYCGKKFTDLTSLISENCYKNPDLNGNQKHVLYPGLEKAEYSCMHCGKKFPNLVALTSDFCGKNNSAINAGKHEPAL